MRKKSGKAAANDLRRDLDKIDAYVADVERANLSKASLTLSYEIALLKTMVALERAVLTCIVIAINNDSSVLTEKMGIAFPKHLTAEVSEFLVIRDGYFDWRGGRDGLLKQVLRYMDRTHWVYVALHTVDKATLDKLVALRNWVAHESSKSKTDALRAIGPRAASPGSWLKTHGRMKAFTTELRVLADEIENGAPY